MYSPLFYLLFLPLCFILYIYSFKKHKKEASQIAISDFFKTNQLKSLVETLTLENKSLKEQIAGLNTELSRSQSLIEEQNSILKKFPFTDFEKLSTQNHFDSFQKTWNIWPSEIHSQIPQMERQLRACSDILTPLDLNSKQGMGHFRGKEYDYVTTLTSCACMDYQRRLLPCKHMYRLAHEFDVFMLSHVSYRTDIHELMHLETVRGKIRHLTQHQQELFETIVRNGYIIDSPSDLQALLKSGLVQVVTDKHIILEYFKKEELYSLIPIDNQPKNKKSLKKADIVEFIIAECPEVISTIEKLHVVAEVHKNASPLIPFI